MSCSGLITHAINPLHCIPITFCYIMNILEQSQLVQLSAAVGQTRFLSTPCQTCLADKLWQRIKSGLINIDLVLHPSLSAKHKQVSLWLTWAGRYTSWLPINSTPKDESFPFLFPFLSFLSFPFLSFPFLSFPFLSCSQSGLEVDKLVVKLTQQDHPSTHHHNSV